MTKFYHAFISTRALAFLIMIALGSETIAQQYPANFKKGGTGISKTIELETLTPTIGTAISPEINIEACVGSPWTLTNPDRAGRFISEGDFELFASSLVGNDPGSCVVTDLTTTHAVQSLQQSGCYVSKWKVTHGTPEVCIEPGQFTQDNRFLHIWAGDWTGNGDFEGEGIYYDCVLDECGFYQISLLLKSTGLIKKIHFYAASGLQHRPKDGTEATSGEVPFYDKPNVPNAQWIWTHENFNSQKWVKITLPIFKPNSNDMKFWLYTEDDNNIAQTGVDLLFIDEVTDGLYGSTATCARNVVYSPTNSVPQLVRGITITAPVTIQFATYTEFSASSSITLTNGFKALGGSNFYAHIVPCASSNNCPSGTALALSQQENVSEIFQIYPNPATNSVIISKQGLEVQQIRLFRESTGEEVGFSQYNEMEDTIEAGLENVEAGTYLLLVNTKSSTKSFRVVIKK